MQQADSITNVMTTERASMLDAERARFARRKLSNQFAGGCMLVLTFASCAILFVLLLYIFVNGISTLFPVSASGSITFNADFFLQPPVYNLDGTVGGGVAQSIVGSLLILLVAGAIAVPIGLGAAIYMSEYGRGPLYRAVDFVIDLLAGLPSIVVGLFILAALIGQLSILNLFQGYAGLAGSLALVVIMVPIIARSVEQILRLVPDTLREAGLALGMPKWKVVLRIVLPSVGGGVATGVMLALARAAGETAPVLLTILGQENFQTNLLEPMDALPVRIYRYATSGDPALVPKAWAGTLILVMVIAVISLLVRYATGKNRYDS